MLVITIITYIYYMEKNLLLRYMREMFLAIGTIILMVAYFYVVNANSMNWLFGWMVIFVAELVLALYLNPRKNHAVYNRIYVWCMLALMLYVLVLGYIIEAYTFANNDITAICPALVIIYTGIIWLVGRAMMLSDNID